MKIDVKTEAPTPPPKTYVLTLTEREMQLLACAANLAPDSFKQSSSAIAQRFTDGPDWTDYCNLACQILDASILDASRK